MCFDPTMQSQFEVVYFRATDNLMILYGCLEMTDMVTALLENAMPMILMMVKQFLAVDLPDFIVQVLVDSVMKALLAQLKVTHLSWHEVLSTSRPLTTA